MYQACTEMDVIFIGASGHAKVLLDALRGDASVRIAGFLDSQAEKGRAALGYSVLGSDEDLPDLIVRYAQVGVVVAIGDNFVRYAVARRLESMCPEIRFLEVRHRAATIAGDVRVGRGTALLAGAIVNPSCELGEFCILNTKSSLDHDCIMGDFASLGPGAVIGGGCRIGSHTAIGIGAVVAHGVDIGENVVVGAGSLVLKSVESNVVVYGSPAKVVRERKPGDRYL